MFCGGGGYKRSVWDDLSLRNLVFNQVETKSRQPILGSEERLG